MIETVYVCELCGEHYDSPKKIDGTLKITGGDVQLFYKEVCQPCIDEHKHLIEFRKVRVRLNKSKLVEQKKLCRNQHQNCDENYCDCE